MSAANAPAPTATPTPPAAWCGSGRTSTTPRPSRPLAHELAHIECGHVEDLPTYLTCRGRCEVEAESVTYVVAAAHGPGHQRLHDRLRRWLGRGNLTRVRQPAENVAKVARTILAGCSSTDTAAAPDDLAAAA